MELSKLPNNQQHQLEIANVVELLKPYSNIVFLVSPIDTIGDGAAEKRMMLSVIDRAIEDLKYLTDSKATKEQRQFGRSAFTWLFVERNSNITHLYPTCNPYPVRKKNIAWTTFDNFCWWLDINSKYLRDKIAKEHKISGASMFLD